MSAASLSYDIAFESAKRALLDYVNGDDTAADRFKDAMRVCARVQLREINAERVALSAPEEKMP